MQWRWQRWYNYVYILRHVLNICTHYVIQFSFIDITPLPHAAAKNATLSKVHLPHTRYNIDWHYHHDYELDRGLECVEYNERSHLIHASWAQDNELPISPLISKMWKESRLRRKYEIMEMLWKCIDPSSSDSICSNTYLPLGLYNTNCIYAAWSYLFFFILNLKISVVFQNFLSFCQKKEAWSLQILYAQ